MLLTIIIRIQSSFICLGDLYRNNLWEFKTFFLPIVTPHVFIGNYFAFIFRSKSFLGKLRFRTNAF